MRRVALLAVLAVVSSGCGQESPTDVGGPLLPPEAIRTFEVILDPADYLVSDTAFSGYTKIIKGGYQIVANAFEGTLDARSMGRFGIPTVVAITDTLGAIQTDSTPHFVAGRFVVRIDTLRSTMPASAEFQLDRIEEDWDPATATWTMRVDSGGAQLPWSQPGGYGGTPIATIEWSPEGTDSLVIPVDSQTIAAWSDTTTKARGAVLSLLTQNTRVRIADMLLRLDATSPLHPDTLFTSTVRPTVPTFVFQPELPANSSQPLASGSPGWRTFFRLRDDLRSLPVPCPLFDGCMIRLDQTSITSADLLLEPAEAPPGFAPQDSMLFETVAVYASDIIPLSRSPLGATVGVTAHQIAPDIFRNVVNPTDIPVPISAFIAGLVSADTANAPPSPYLALLPYVEGADFGVVAFRKRPRLRLVLTIATELHLR